MKRNFLASASLSQQYFALNKTGILHLDLWLRLKGQIDCLWLNILKIVLSGKYFAYYPDLMALITSRCYAVRNIFGKTTFYKPEANNIQTINNSHDRWKKKEIIPTSCIFLYVKLIVSGCCRNTSEWGRVFAPRSYFVETLANFLRLVSWWKMEYIIKTEMHSVHWN